MLKEIINDRINVVEKVGNWEEAIKVAAKPLVDDLSVKESYVEAMIENVKKFGTYIVVAPKVAMPHSRPEHGVNKNCLSLLKINEGIFFGDDTDEEDKVYLVFVLGTVNNDSHINTLTQLMDIIDDEEKIEKLSELKTVSEIKELL